MEEWNRRRRSDRVAGNGITITPLTVNEQKTRGLLMHGQCDIGYKATMLR